MSESKPTLNHKVVHWALGKWHLRVKIPGHKAGECWDFAEMALRKAGAKTSYDLGEVTPDSDYVWGNPVETRDVIPGDILQMRDYKETTETVTKYTFSDGTWLSRDSTAEMKHPHHTAIVRGMMDPKTGVIPTLEQHVGHSGVVLKMQIYTRDVPAIVTTTTETHKNPNSKKFEKATVITTVTRTVDPNTRIWAYRPISKG
jgi:hypothetical protein